MHPCTRFAVVSSAAAVFSLAITAFLRMKKRRRRSRRSRKNPKYWRIALLRPVHTDLQTPWNKIVSCGTDDDFLISVNFTRPLLVDTMLPPFTWERQRCNWGSPYRNGVKTRGRKPQLKSIDLLVMALWYLKTRATMFSLCPIFGLVPSSIGVWLDYSLEVLLRVVKKKTRKEFEIRWPTEAEMQTSSSILQSNRTFGPDGRTYGCL